MITILRIVLTVLLTLVLLGPAWAQTQLNTTTLAAPITAGATSLTVASASGVVAGGGLYVGREYMTVGSGYVSGTTVPVLRISRAVAHTLGEPLYAGPATAFINTDRDGACTPSAEAFLPQINVTNGNVWNCFTNVNEWVNERDAVVVTCRALLITDQIDQSCFTADRPYLVYKITYVTAVAEAIGTLTIIPRRQTGTQTPAAGVALATAINAVAAGTPAETVVTATLSAAALHMRIHTGNRLGLDYTGDVAGELAGVVVVFYLYAL